MHISTHRYNFLKKKPHYRKTFKICKKALTEIGQIVIVQVRVRVDRAYGNALATGKIDYQTPGYACLNSDCTA